MKSHRTSTTAVTITLTLVAVAIPVARVSPIWRDGGVLGATDRVCLNGQDLVDEVCQHLTQQIRRGLSQVTLQDIRSGRYDWDQRPSRVLPSEDR